MKQALKSYFGTVLGFFFIILLFTGNSVLESAGFSITVLEDFSYADYGIILALMAFVQPIAFSFQTPALMTSGRKQSGQPPFSAEEILGSGLLLCSVTSAAVMVYLTAAAPIVDGGFRRELMQAVLQQGLLNLPIMFLSFLTGYLASRGRIETALGGILLWSSVKALLLWYFCRFVLRDLSPGQWLFIQGIASAAAAIYYFLLLKYELKTGRLKVKLSVLWFLLLGCGLMVSQHIFNLPDMLFMNIVSQSLGSDILNAMNIAARARVTILIPLSAFTAAAVMIFSRIGIGDKDVKRIWPGALIGMHIAALVGAALLILLPEVWIPVFSMDPSVSGFLSRFRILLFLPLIFEAVPALAVAYTLGRRQYRTFYLLLLFRLFFGAGGTLSLLAFPQPTFLLWAVLGINAGFLNCLAASAVLLVTWNREKNGRMSFVDPSVA